MKGLKADKKHAKMLLEKQLLASYIKVPIKMCATWLEQLREHIFDSKQRFDGEFSANAQEKSVPHILSSFIIDMVLCGPSVKRQDRKSVALFTFRMFQSEL